MALNKKIALPLLVLLLAFAAGGGWFLWQNQRTGKSAAEKAIEVKQLYTDRKSTRLNSSHRSLSRMPSSA